MQDGKMITVSEAARDMGVAVSSLYRYIKKYKLTIYRKLGDKQAYLRAEDVERLKGFMPKEKANT